MDLGVAIDWFMLAGIKPGDHKLTYVRVYCVGRIGRDFDFVNFNYTTSI